MTDDVRLIQGDALAVLKTLPSASVDCCITDPPYPCIKRSYGYWTEAEWFALMRGVVPEVMRTLKPSGSAVFILQPNSERVGRMRTWLWEFMLWVGKEWGIVQDAWWWRFDTMPTEGAPTKGLMRQSLKACVWIGLPDCWRNQDAVLWEESDYNRAARLTGRCDRGATPSKWRPNATPIVTDQKRVRAAAERRGGVTPFNVIPETNGSHRAGHSAPTSLKVCSWWTRYLCPPGGVCLDPFAGSGTTALAALKHGASWVGIERVPEYVAIARKRIEAAQAERLQETVA